jgi:hypothetical protein
MLSVSFENIDACVSIQSRENGKKQPDQAVTGPALLVGDAAVSPLRRIVFQLRQIIPKELMSKPIMKSQHAWFDISYGVTNGACDSDNTFEYAI